MFCEAVQHRLRFCLHHLSCVKMAAFQFYLQSGKQWKLGWVRDGSHVDFGQRFPGEKGSERRSVVVMQQPASTPNIAIIEHFQSKALRMIVDTPWFVPNTVIRRDLQIPTVKEVIRRYSSQYSARQNAHPNDLIVNLIQPPDNRRLRRHM
jgi:hypothetical protein